MTGKQKTSLYTMAVLYVLAGVNHFLNPFFYQKMVANFLPKAYLLVLVSGVIEVGLGIALLLPQFRKYAGWGIILLLIAIFPANINMAMHATEWGLSPIGLLFRLPIQFVLIYWSYTISKLED